MNSLLNTVIVDRYRIIDELGSGGVGITYRAKDLQTDRIVVLKALSLKRAKDWKAIELFDREAKILSQLQHPAIPEYLDYFQVESEIDRQFYIVQSLAEGRSLFAAIESGWQPTIEEVKDIASQILKILQYLHALTPPVIHRDLKPQNIIISESGKIYLVDFGAVQDSFYTVSGGSTIVGTYGYMAPEQFRGQAYLSTDLYGLGTTILYLLTGKDPATLPQQKLKIDFRDAISLPADFASWLDRLLEPEANRRLSTATLALDILHGRDRLPVLPPKQPSYSRIKLDRDEDTLKIIIPPIGLSSPASRRLGAIALMSSGLLFTLLFYSLQLSLFINPSSQIFFIVFGLISLAILVIFSYGAISRVSFEISGTSNTTQLNKFLFGSKYLSNSFDNYNYQFVSGKLLTIPFLNDAIYLKSKGKSYSIATLLTSQETKWLVSEIESFLANSIFG
jgi:eukaryotic-like serine/threonine-protein kinase